MFGSNDGKPGKDKTGGTSLKAGKSAGALPGTVGYDKWQKDVHAAQVAGSRLTMRGENTLAEMAESDQIFQQICSIVGINPSRRQYSKWLNKHGASRTQLRRKLDEKLGSAQHLLDTAEDRLRDANKAGSKFNAEKYVSDIESNKDDETLAVEQVEAEFEGTLVEYKQHLCKMEEVRLDTEIQNAEAAKFTASERVTIEESYRKKYIGKAV